MQLDQLRRREVITLLGGAAAVWPLAGRAQQDGRLPTIGYMGGTTAAQSSQATAAFSQRLRELGWVEGRTIAIEYRWAEGRSERFAEIAAEFVRLKVALILTTGDEQSLVAKQATSTIPIVFAIGGDPVAVGLVASLARPGSNVTGLSNQLTDAVGKRVGLLHEAVPGLRRLAILAYINPLSTLESAGAEAAAMPLGLEVLTLKIRQAEDITLGFDALKNHADALYVANSAFLAANRLRITTAALVARLPTMFGSRDWLDAGGMMSYGTSFTDRFRRSADIVDKILRGTKPADIPVEQPTKFELAVNLITAKAIGLDISPTLRAQADEVIE
jgi:putative ABC transport system substrate-binding protein